MFSYLKKAAIFALTASCFSSVFASTSTNLGRKAADIAFQAMMHMAQSKILIARNMWNKFDSMCQNAESKIEFDRGVYDRLKQIDREKMARMAGFTEQERAQLYALFYYDLLRFEDDIRRWPKKEYRPMGFETEVICISVVRASREVYGPNSVKRLGKLFDFFEYLFPS